MVRSLNIHFPYVVVCGPTASGKSSLAMQIASEWNGEIVSFDSVQFYKGFDIGSAKPTLAEQAAVPHHMIDILDWNQDYDASLYARDARALVEDIRSRGRLPVLVGGSGLFLRAFWGEGWHENLPKNDSLREQLGMETSESLYATLVVCDPQRAAQLHQNDKFRLVRALELFHLTGKTFAEVTNVASQAVAHRGFVIKLSPDRQTLHDRIAERSEHMLNEGLIEETLLLLDKGCAIDCRPMHSIGYRQATDFLMQRFPQKELCEKIVVATRQYAKRQFTWFNKVEANFTSTGNLSEALMLTKSYLCRPDVETATSRI